MIEKEIYGKNYLEVELEDALEAKVLGNDYTVEDWPWGRKQRCSMHFFIETNKRGQRYVKQSTMKGRTYKPKASTYDLRVIIVEIDGKVGNIGLTRSGFVSVHIEDGKYLEANFWDADAKVLVNKFFLT